MNLSDFDYSLPLELIAQHPLEKRDHARLLVLEKETGKITHDRFSNISLYLPPMSVLVLNDSKVIPARLWGKREKTGGKVEIFLLNRLSDGYSFEALIKPLKRLNAGEKIIFEGKTISCELIDPLKRIVRFNRKDILKELSGFGHVPLPPYIKREDNPKDKVFYQTVYAKTAGSVASPTAGLHFTKPLLSALQRQGHEVLKVTLHVNYATFRSVTEVDITKHHMHFESYEVAQKVFDRIMKAKSVGRKIMAVGTTGCRTLETIAASGPLKGQTNLFIYPGYQFKMTDILLTNFHTPKSTLLMLVSAFAGRENIFKAYNEAIEEKYRFFSYGDCMLII